MFNIIHHVCAMETLFEQAVYSSVKFIPELRLGKRMSILMDQERCNCVFCYFKQLQ